MTDPFDKNGNLILTPDEVQEVTDRLYQTPEPLRRQIIAAIAGQLSHAKLLLQEVDYQVGNGSTDRWRHTVTPDLRDRVAAFLK
jgi:hypothetical protein